MKIIQGCLVVVAALAVAGCASGVRRDAEGGYAAAAAVKVSGASVTLSPAAQTLAAGSPKFSLEHLGAAVKKALEAKGLITAGNPMAEVVVTGFRVRGTFSAIMWGAMAGTDNVTGDVVVRDAGGKVLRKFTVNASYGLGGFAGGQDDMRLNWLYDKFAEHTAAELSGTPLKD